MLEDYTVMDLVSVIRMGRTAPARPTPTPRSETELMERFEAGDPEAIEAVEALTKEEA